MNVAYVRALPSGKLTACFCFNGHLQLIYPLKMVIFQSYISLPYIPYILWQTNIAIEHGHLQLIYQFNMVISISIAISNTTRGYLHEKNGGFPEIWVLPNRQFFRRICPL